MKLIFATNNAHKIEEIRSILGDRMEILTLKEAGIDQDIPEPFETLEENAVNKSKVIYNLTGMDCFSEDTGLEVEALDGAPGVKSARYAGEGRSSFDNIQKLLTNLEGSKNRNARFRTVISLFINGKQWLFEGICPGRILQETAGNSGFGYDPVFVPEGASRTFAQMDMSEKNLYSHRRIATEKLVGFLNELSANH